MPTKKELIYTQTILATKNFLNKQNKNNYYDNHYQTPRSFPLDQLNKLNSNFSIQVRSTGKTQSRNPNHKRSCISLNQSKIYILTHSTVKPKNPHLWKWSTGHTVKHGSNLTNLRNRWTLKWINSIHLMKNNHMHNYYSNQYR